MVADQDEKSQHKNSKGVRAARWLLGWSRPAGRERTAALPVGSGGSR
jgi:hypothetical protein